MSVPSLPAEPNARRLSRAVAPVFITGVVTVFLLLCALWLLAYRAHSASLQAERIRVIGSEAGLLVAKSQTFVATGKGATSYRLEQDAQDWSSRAGRVLDPDGEKATVDAVKNLLDEVVRAAREHKPANIGALTPKLEALATQIDQSARQKQSAIPWALVGIGVTVAGLVGQAFLTIRAIRWRLAVVVRAEVRDLLEDQQIAHEKEMAVAGDRATQALRAKQADVEAQAEALRMALSKAEEASLVKSAFLGNISHEIRTPLNGIIATAELLAQSHLDSEQSDLVNTIVASGDQLTRIIQDVLDLAQIEAGRLTLEDQPFDIGLLIGETVLPYEALARAKGVEFVITLPPEDERTVASDPLRLRQILGNLVSNAAKFTHKGKIEVAVEAIRNGADMVELRVSVSDTGIGIEPSRLPFIFERFSQADNSSKRIYGGTGLGLTIAKQLVELLGGQIGVNSERGVGSHFWVALPVQHATAESIPSPQAPIVTEIPHFGMKVLVAEDNLVNQKMIQRLLQRCGCSVDLAENGAEAVERAMYGNYDVILMDIHMPVMDGVEATVEIRRKEKAWQRRRTPIVAVTADVMEERRRKFLEAGMEDFVPKPVRLATLLPALERRASQTMVVGKDGR